MHTTYKLNTDGASSTSMDMAGICAIIRDQKGSCIGALAVNIGMAINVLAELWAIRDGLILAKQKIYCSDTY